jgi:hypothetical protein
VATPAATTRQAPHADHTRGNPIVCSAARAATAVAATSSLYSVYLLLRGTATLQA